MFQYLCSSAEFPKKSVGIQRQVGVKDFRFKYMQKYYFRVIAAFKIGCKSRPWKVLEFDPGEDLWL